MEILFLISSRAYDKPQTTSKKKANEKDKYSLSSYWLVIKAFAKEAVEIIIAPKKSNILPLLTFMIPASDVSVRSLFKPLFFRRYKAIEATIIRKKIPHSSLMFCEMARLEVRCIINFPKTQVLYGHYSLIP